MTRLSLVVALGLAVGLSACARAGELKVGDAAPDWSKIVGTDDKEHSLADYKDAKVLVVVFTCNTCPVARAYEERLMKLQSDYKDKGVRLIAVNVNNLPGDRLDKMKERAQEKGFNFPYLYDSTQKIAEDYGAKVTPHVFLLDAARKLAYVGAIDDSQKADAVSKHYLKDAIDAVLAGKQPDPATTKQFGCSVKYEKKSASK